MNWNPTAIVVGIDGSDGSNRAAEIATEIARSAGAKLLLVTVIRPPEGWWGITDARGSVGGTGRRPAAGVA